MSFLILIFVIWCYFIIFVTKLWFCHLYFWKKRCFGTLISLSPEKPYYTITDTWSYQEVKSWRILGVNCRIECSITLGEFQKIQDNSKNLAKLSKIGRFLQVSFNFDEFCYTSDFLGYNFYSLLPLVYVWVESFR